MDPNQIRLEAAKEYYSRIKKEMADSCTEAFIFGSVARNKAKKSSDLDLLLVLERPTREERYFWNTPQEMTKRNNYSYNFAKNSHQIFIIQRELERKYNFPISVHFRYKDSDDIVPLPIKTKDLASSLIKL